MTDNKKTTSETTETAAGPMACGDPTCQCGMGKGAVALIVILTVVVLDQLLKIWVKTHFYLGEDMVITKWFHLCFIENNGMAFGWTVGSKLVLTLSRILLAGLAIWYIWTLRHRAEARCGFIVCLSLVVAGAIGNIIDCVFYGLIFNNPMPPEVAVMFPEGGGYAPLFHGRVVDMLYFPLFDFNWPQWVPLVGGEHFVFFRPVFNLADAAITVGVIAILIFYSGWWSSRKPSESQPIAEENPKD